MSNALAPSDDPSDAGPSDAIVGLEQAARLLPDSSSQLVVDAAQPRFPGQQGFDGYYAVYEVDIGPVPPCDDVVSATDSVATINAALNNGRRTTCFNPGVYRDSYRIDGTSGTEGRPKWLRLRDAGTAHPYHLPRASQAIFTRPINMVDAHHWVFHRTTHDLELADDSWVQLESSRFNIFDHIVGRNIGTRTGSQQTGIQFDNGSTDNTIQNSVFHTSAVMRQAAVLVVSIKRDTRIVNNEMFNIMEGFGQPQKSPHGGAYGEGAIIENNDFYYTSAWYTDCKGNWDPDGDCMAAEGSFDLKSGGTPDAPMRFIHNRFWGTRRSDTSMCCTSGGRGHAIILIADDPGNITRYVEIRDNIFMNSARGVFDTKNGGDSIDHISLVRNLFYSFDGRPDGQDNLCFSLDQTDDTEIYFNTCVRAQVASASSSSARNIDVRCNVFVAANAITGEAGKTATWDYNAFFATKAFSTASPGHNVIYPAAVDARAQQRCFRRKQWTVQGGQEVCVPHALPTSVSPHYGQCAGVQVGSQAGLGVDDRLYETGAP